MPHDRTRECVDKARAFLDREDPDRFRYASLHLRMAIEYLFYELLDQYRDELPDDITARWKPQEIIDAILECNPTADQGGSVVFGNVGPDGNLVGPCLDLKVKPPSRKLLRKVYHRLGKYLHAPVDLKTPPLKEWKSELDEVISILDEWRDDIAVFNNYGDFATIDCKCCGRQIKRNVLGVEATKEIRCPDTKCRAIFDIEHFDAKSGHIRFKLRQSSFDCPACKTPNVFSVGGMRNGLRFSCVECNEPFEVYSTLAVRHINQTT
jgi:hypothetical protein